VFPLVEKIALMPFEAKMKVQTEVKTFLELPVASESKKIVYQLKGYVMRKNLGGVTVGALWCNFSAALLYIDDTSVTTYKICMI